LISYFTVKSTIVKDFVNKPNEYKKIAIMAEGQTPLAQKRVEAPVKKMFIENNYLALSVVEKIPYYYNPGSKELWELLKSEKIDILISVYNIQFNGKVLSLEYSFAGLDNYDVSEIHLSSPMTSLGVIAITIDINVLNKLEGEDFLDYIFTIAGNKIYEEFNNQLVY
jgi:hypothetical protein